MDGLGHLYAYIALAIKYKGLVCQITSYYNAFLRISPYYSLHFLYKKKHIKSFTFYITSFTIQIKKSL
jgi:hypothetical protein